MSPVRNSQDKNHFKDGNKKDSGTLSSKIESGKGFTLLEITVVVAIIILLSTIFVINYQGGEKQFVLKRSTHKLAQDLRAVQEMAMSSQETPPGLGLPETFPKGGYGIYFEKNSNSYILFADCDGESDYDSWGSNSCENAATGEGNSLNEKIEEFFLEEEIYISGLSSGENSLIVTFFPPEPIINIYPVADWASITLSFNGQYQKTVIIYANGLIDID